jgi:hypothetical protein
VWFFVVFDISLFGARPGCGREEVVGMCVLFSRGRRVRVPFLSFWGSSLLCGRSVVGSLNGCLCAAGSMGDGMGSGGVMAGWAGLRSISSGR